MMKIYTKTFCPYCIRLLELLDEASLEYELCDISHSSHFQDEMFQKSGSTGVPQVAIENVIIYDYISEDILVSEIQKIIQIGNVDESFQKNLTSTFNYIS